MTSPSAAEAQSTTSHKEDSHEADSRAQYESDKVDVDEEAADATLNDSHSLSSESSSVSTAPRALSNPEKTEDGISSTDAPVIAPSIRSQRSAKVVPASQRRGLFSRITIIAEVDSPKLYRRRTKWFLTFCVAVGGVAAPLGSTIFLPSLEQVNQEFGTTPALTNLSVALYMLAMSIFPIWWSAFSEALGRRSVYIISFALFTVFTILCARSTSIAMLIVTRLLSGGAAASVQAVGAGTIADLWDVFERGRAMGIFYLGPLCGPLIGPIVGGILAEYWGWRSTQWFLTIYGGVTWIMLLFFLPETLVKAKPILAQAEAESDDPAAAQSRSNNKLTRTLSARSVQKTSKKYLIIARKVFLDPLKILRYLRFPAVAITVAYASTTFAALYVLNISIQAVFEAQPYNYSTLIVGLLYIPNSLGYIIASIFGGKWTDRIMAREARKAGRYDEKGKLIYRPEDRMRENAWFGAVLTPVALLWYGWTADQGVIWIVPMIANFFFGIGSMLIFAVATTMLTEFMPRRASAGIALNNFVRNICSCVGGIITQPIIEAIGNGWMLTIVGVLTAGASMTIWAMRRFGPRWREEMDRKMD